MSDLDQALKALDSARPDYDLADNMYRGRAPEVFASRRVQRVLKANSDFNVNYARVPVHSRLTRLKISAVTVADDPRAEREVERMWMDNEMALECPETHEAALSLGDAYVYVWPNADDESRVDIFFNSPLSVRLFYDPENPRIKRYAVKRWQEGEHWRTDLIYPDRIEPYITKTPGLTSPEADDMVEYSEDEDGTWPLPNPYGEVPIFHFRTERPYGRPEHFDAYGPQSAITKLVTSQMSTVDFTAFPQRYALEELEKGEGSDDWDDDQDDVAVETPELKSGPGEVWWLKGVRAVGQFAAADPKVFIDPVRENVNHISSTTDTPLHTFRLDGTMPSGESYRRADAPLANRVGDLQTILGSTWRQVFQFGLRIRGYGDVQVLVSWTEPSSYDSKDIWETAGLQLTLGVPVRQILMERGYTVAQLEEWGIPDPANMPKPDPPANPAAVPSAEEQTE